MRNNNHNAGFAVLVSVVLLGSILLALAAANDLSGFSVRSAHADALYKAKSLELAKGCVDMLLLRLATDAQYMGDETISIDTDSCKIFQSTFGNPRSFLVQAVFHHAYTNVNTTIDVATLQIISKSEIANI